MGEPQNWRMGMYKTLRELNSKEELRNEANEAELEANRGLKHIYLIWEK